MFTVVVSVTVKVAVMCDECQAEFTAEYEAVTPGDKVEPLDQVVCPKCGHVGMLVRIAGANIRKRHNGNIIH